MTHLRRFAPTAPAEWPWNGWPNAGGIAGRMLLEQVAEWRGMRRLIIEHNIHGIDIDPRAAQIAGLSLWLRAQRAWQEQGLRREDRPRIRRSNIACAEPMPGEGAYLDEFIAAHLSTTPEQRLLGQLVRRVFAAMRLAGEAGSLLKIEDEIAGAVAEARQQWLTGAKKPEQLGLFGDDRPAPECVLGRFGYPEFVVGMLQQLPLPSLAPVENWRIGDLVHRAWLDKRALDAVNSISHAFLFPALLTTSAGSLSERGAAWASRIRSSEETVAAIQAEIDDIAFRLYGLDSDDRAALASTLATGAAGEAAESGEEEEEDEISAADHSALTAELLAYTLGCGFGRWDIRYATRERQAPEIPEPFDPLPVSPPGQLQNAQGLPVGPDDLPAAYPVDIPWDGILVDDPGHERDLTVRSRGIFEIVFADDADAAWREATEILEGRGNDLRAWFTRSFFPDHIKRYSKSRRKAPIYWQLATPSASYSVWLYYHRFTRDTLYKVLNDSVTPKLQHEERKLMGLAQGAGGTPTASQRKEIAEQEGFVEEVRAFREEVACVAPLWNPDLNDGVIINFAPLWRLVPQHRAWQKECKDCWDKLTAGAYDWSHLAMHLWPERVVPKCATDRSLAIAHGLEEAFWEEGDDGKWRVRVQGAGFRIQDVIADLVRERTSAAVKDALNSLLEAPAPVAVRAGGRKPSGRTRAPKRVKAAGFSAQGSGLNHLNPVPGTPNPEPASTPNPEPHP